MIKIIGGNISTPQYQYTPIRFKLKLSDGSPYFLKEDDKVFFLLRNYVDFEPLEIINTGKSYVDIEMPSKLPVKDYTYVLYVDNPVFKDYYNFLKTDGLFTIRRSKK